MLSNEIQRIYHIIQIFLSYRLNDLFPKMRVILPINLWRKMFFWIADHHKDQVLGERLCLALQKLGPVWIKLGQMLSTCHNIFPSSITDHLSSLQAKVAPFDGMLARQQIEKSMGNLPIEAWFDNFDINPLASASIAQVHTARLKSNNKEVVIKIIRPEILSLIKVDIKLIYRLANWIPRIFPNMKRLRLIEIVQEFERTLINEINLLKESINTIQLRRNFENSSILYVPEVYLNYCSQTMMVVERIHGIPISDTVALKQNGINMKLLAERGVQIFFTQVFRDSFFHADMHPGNIFVSYKHPNNPQYIGIDYGIVGSLSNEDKHYLAENLIAFFNHDYRKVAELHVNYGWLPLETNLKDFEFAIYTILEPVFKKPLSEISFGHILLKLFNTTRRFNMEVKPQLVLLQKTLLYIEGLGKKIYPQLDLWKTAKPFLESWINDQIGLSVLIRSLKERTPFWITKVPKIPEIIHENIHRSKNLQVSLDKIVSELVNANLYSKYIRYLFITTIILLFIILVLVVDGYA